MAKDWIPHVVQQGDHVQKLAFRRGVKPEDVWSHEKNADLKSRRKSMEMLCPGDVLFLPDEPGPALDVAAGTGNRYRATVPTVTASFTLDRSLGDVAGKAYEVRGIPGSPDPLPGVVGGDGLIELHLPIWVREVTVVIPSMGISAHVSVGDLDPLDEPSGVKQRLRHLGHLHADGPVSDEQASGAIATFQREAGLPVTGSADAATLAALESAHKL